jgi:hypothetical protein
MQKYSYVGGTSPSIGYHHYCWNFVVIKTRAQKRKERKSRDLQKLIMKIKSREKKISRKILRLTSQKNFAR